MFSFRGIDLYIFFLYLCPVGTLLACYSVPRQVEDECENETWISCFKVLVSLITVCAINLMNMKKKILLLCLLFSWVGVFAQKPMEGVWMGKLNLGPQWLTIVLHVNCNAQGKVECTLDSPDQGAKGIAVETDYCSSDSISVSLASLALSYQGKLKGDEIVGTFTQGQPFPLTLKRGEEKLNRP